ncbi:type IV pilin [Halosolutus amylolyticus]|uniref:Type IV pilin n=1 Tax=Halosolutus amylolyticus TaxID=2932267 RepID=A0ABD5PKF6_9EURY|nr:type IV pilin N-terminal domain-containing protein [Halosolutus amylolyticus]
MLENIGKKLVGNDEERAVSPVIGVILMVAITVILAAVIAAFVLDLGDSVNQEAQAGASMTWDTSPSDGELSIELTSEGNADNFYVRGDLEDESPVSGEEGELDGAGDTMSLDCGGNGLSGSGTVTVVAEISDTETQTTVTSEDYDCSNT